MNLLFTIFRYEWLQLKRNRLMIVLLLVLTCCAGYAIYYGQEKIKQQIKVIQYLDQQNDSTRQTFYTYFADAKLADSVRFDWADMNSIYDGWATESFLKNNFATNQPNSLSHLSIGQRDVYPLYRKVSARSLYYDGNGISLDEAYSEISNPHKLLAGHFDLSFVLIYLFPLFIIAFCFNLLSQEKEQGTYALLGVQSAGLVKVTIYRLLFRFVLFACLLLLFSTAGFLFSPVTISNFSYLVPWLGTGLLYMLFWFAVCWLIIAFNKDSSFNALALVGCWIVFLILIPALVNNYVAATKKVNSRTALIKALQKQTSAIWDMPDSIPFKSYYIDYPQYKKEPAEILWTAQDSFDSLGKNEELDWRYNKKMVLWHYYLGKTVENEISTYQQQLNAKLNAAASFNAINPAVAVQESFNQLAASGTASFQDFREQVKHYRNQLFNRTNQFVFDRKKLTADDYKGYGKFEMNTSSNQVNSNNSAVAYLFIWSLLLFLLGRVLFQVKTKTG